MLPAVECTESDTVDTLEKKVPHLLIKEVRSGLTYWLLVLARRCATPW